MTRVPGVEVHVICDPPAALQAVPYAVRYKSLAVRREGA